MAHQLINFVRVGGFHDDQPAVPVRVISKSLWRFTQQVIGFQYYSRNGSHQIRDGLACFDNPEWSVLAQDVVDLRQFDVINLPQFFSGIVSDSDYGVIFLQFNPKMILRVKAIMRQFHDSLLELSNSGAILPKTFG